MTTLDEIKRTAGDLLTVRQESVESGEDVAPSAFVFMADKSVGLSNPNFDDKRQAWIDAANRSSETGIVAVLIITDSYYLRDPDSSERIGESLSATILQNGSIASVGVLDYTRHSSGHIEWEPLEWDDTAMSPYLTPQDQDVN